MRFVRPFNASWTFSEGFDPSNTNTKLRGAEVTLPHNAVNLPMSYFDETTYQRPFTYQKQIEWEPGFAGKEIYLRFEGAMADSVVYLNGVKVCSHADGYTPFEARLTDHLRQKTNLVTVKVDGSENPDIPPFGGRIDYLTYAGIYREVHLQIRPALFIENVKVEPSDVLAEKKSVSVTCFLANPRGLKIDGSLKVRIKERTGAALAEANVPVSSDRATVKIDDLEGIDLWDIDAPILYSAELQLTTEHGHDDLSTPFGFRTAIFHPDGFRLNGRPVKLMGVNRHQSFPHVGYALGRAAQERDAEIVKFDLGCNVVRTSHYPQCPHFLDHCDRIGLLVLTEIPGWQHIGGQSWRDASVENVKRMIVRDWNHPSIVTWGVRINESRDDHDFYRATNDVARALDGTRQTSGVRKHANSELLEDIYTMNDFSQGAEEVTGGSRVFLKDQREQTGLDDLVPYMITECNGHMFPTKVTDQEARQVEHVTRHLNVLNRMFGDPHIAGCISWCMFDYHTHKDFGSGDRICYHGVMTMFREPKFAAHVYASQRDPRSHPVLVPVTYYARGERNIGGVLPLIILTNADEVELRFAGGAAYRFKPDTIRYPHLPHAPIVVDRDDLPAEAFGKWGMNWQDLEIAGLLDGTEIRHIKLAAAPIPEVLEIVPDRTEISADRRDCLRVIVRALDQFGNKLPFLADQAQIAVIGPADLIGPNSTPFLGGSTGFWVRSNGEQGPIRITVSSNSFPEHSVCVSAF